MKKVVNDTTVEVRFTGAAFGRPTGVDSKLDSEAFKAIGAGVRRVYNVPTIPTMGTGATDMPFTRAKGIQCFGLGPASDMEDAPRGFGAHSDQERILESELHRFVRLNWELVTSLTRAGGAPVPYYNTDIEHKVGWLELIEHSVQLEECCTGQGHARRRQSAPSCHGPQIAKVIPRDAPATRTATEISDTQSTPEVFPTTARETTQARAERPSLRAQAAFSSASSMPWRQSHSMQRSVMPRLVSFLSTNLALHVGHGCGTGLSHATKSHCFFAQLEQP
jgi:hypothetical protein